MRNAKASSRMTKSIIDLNDTFRSGERLDRVTIVGRSVHERGEWFVEAAKEAVRIFNKFDSQTDRNSDHSKGIVYVDGVPILFTIQYLDLVSLNPAKDPSNVLTTRRVLLIEALKSNSGC